MDDLYNFYVNQNKSLTFNSKDSNSVIIVQVPEKMNFSDEYDPKFNQLPVHLMSCHLLENNNKSSISEKAMKEAIPSFYNRPILGYIQEIENEDGTTSYDFAGHEMELNDDGEIEYKEMIVGVIPESCNPQLVYSEENDKTYLEVDGIIYEDYTRAAEILRDKGQCDVSVEIAVNSLSYQADTKILNIESFTFLGVTILGVTTDDSHRKIAPGMSGANITISDFSAENNSFIFNRQELINEVTTAVLKQLSNKKAEFSAEETNGKEVGEVAIDNENINFEEAEVEEVETKEVEDVEVETTDEETPAIETEASKEEEESDDDAAETPEVVEEEFDGEPEEEPEEETEEETDDDSEEEHQSVSAIEDEDSTGTRVENSLNYSVTIDGVKKEFAVSLADKINALTTLVNDTYSESDNAYYYVDVFEEDRYVIMHDFWNDKHFKQDFSVKKDVYQLKSDRVAVYARYLTADQINQLDKMKSDFSAIESELNEYKSKELHAAREAVLASEDYSVMVDFAEFKDLKDHMDEYSVEDLGNKADLIYAKFMKSNYSTFAGKDQSKKHSVVFMTTGSNTEEERLPYGGLFKNFKAKK